MLASGARLGPALTRTAFASSPLAVEPTRLGAAWSSAALGAHAIGDARFLITLRFDGERLAIIELYLVRDGDPRSWDGWTAAQELARKREHDAWLVDQLGAAPWSYGWGSIESTFDPRGGSSGITIRFALGVAARATGDGA
jgi:hypothetical protein